MNIKTILLFVSMLAAFDTSAQKTNLGRGFEGYEMTSLRTATNLEEVYIAFEEILSILIKNKKYTLTITSGFSNPDIILELIRVDTCRTCFEYDKYIINLSEGLSTDSYREILHYAQQMNSNTYHNKRLYGHLLYVMTSILDEKVSKHRLIKKQDKTYELKVIYNEANDKRSVIYYSFIKELLLHRVEYGDFRFFDWEFYRKNLITDEICEAVKQQLKDPKYPPYLLEQYMADNKHRWAPALVDTTGIPRKYMDNQFLTCHPQDTLCQKYLPIIENFRFYETRAKKQGITLGEALYRQIESEFYFKGFKDFSYMIDYATDTRDMRLLPAIKEFVGDYPEYKLTDKQKDFLEEWR